MTDKIICREPIRMSEWDFDMDLDIGPIIAKKVSKLVSDAFEEDPPLIRLTSVYGGGPLTLSLSLPLGPGNFDDAIYDFELKDLVKDYIDEVGPPYKGHPEAIRFVSNALRELADWMDTHIQEVAA